MTEELISFASKQDMLAKSKQFWNPDKTQFWIDSGVPLVIDRREGYFIYDVEGKRLIDVHLNGGTYNLGHRNPEVAAAVTAAMQRFDIGNHHFPSLARTALAEALVSTAPDGLTQGDVRQRRRGGHRHRAEERAARHQEARHRLGGQGLPRAHRARRGHRRRAVRHLVPGRPAGRVQPRAVQRPGRHGGRAARPGRGRRDHGDDPGHLRLPAARARLPGRSEKTLRALRRALHRRRGADRADAYRRAVGHQQARRQPGHPGHGQGHLRRHVPGQRGARDRGRRGLADRGRLRPHVHVRRRRTRLRGGAEDAGDHRPARGPVDGALHRGDLHRAD